MTSWAFFFSTKVVTVLAPCLRARARLVGVSSLPAARASARALRRALRSCLVSGRYLSRRRNSWVANHWKQNLSFFIRKLIWEIFNESQTREQEENTEKYLPINCITRHWLNVIISARLQLTWAGTGSSWSLYKTRATILRGSSARHGRLRLLSFSPRGVSYQPVCLSRAVWNWLIAGGILRRVWRTAFWRWSLMYLGHLMKRLKSLLGWISWPMPKLRVRFSKRGFTTLLVSGFLTAKGAAATFLPFLFFPYEHNTSLKIVMNKDQCS